MRQEELGKETLRVVRRSNLCPTGRANLFDMRKILWHSGRREEKEYGFFSILRGKEKCVGVPVYRSTEKRVLETSISLISSDKQNYKIT